MSTMFSDRFAYSLALLELDIIVVLLILLTALTPYTLLINFWKYELLYIVDLICTDFVFYLCYYCY